MPRQEPDQRNAAQTHGGVDSTGETMLVADGVRKTYRSGEIEVHALAGLDLHIRRGEFVAVMGPSGSGKTTLLNCLSGLDGIDEGRVLLDGRDLFAMRDAARTAHRAASMGFVFQGFNLIPVLTAVENVELPLLIGGVRPRKARRRATEVLEQVELGHRAAHRPNELSGGEQQRVAIARALAGRPALVWADEPTGNLDARSAERIVTLLAKLNRIENQTIVVVTHEAWVAAAAGRVLQLHDGRLVADERRSEAPAGTP